jgi:hypothetical protein
MKMADANLKGLMVDDLARGRRPLGNVVEYATDANGNVTLLGPDGQIRPEDATGIDAMGFSGPIFAAFDTLTGYAGSNCTISLVDTPAGGPPQPKGETGKSIRATATGVATANVSAPISGISGSNNSRFDYWVYIEDYTKISQVIIYLGVDSAYSAHYFKQETTNISYNGWHHFTALESECTVGGGSPTFATIAYARVRFVFSAAGTAIVDRVVASSGGTPKLCLIWDDSTATDYTKVLQLLNKYKLIGNFAVIPSIIGTANFCTQSQVDQINAAGHKIKVHGATNLTTYGTIDEAITDINTATAAVAAMGGASDVYVWPNGQYMYTAGNTGLMDHLIASGFRGAFRVGGVGYPTDPAYYQKYSSQRQALDSTVSAVNTLAKISLNAAAGIGSALMGHRVVTSGATSTEINYADLETVLSGIADLRDAGKVRVMSARDYLG